MMVSKIMINRDTFNQITESARCRFVNKFERDNHELLDKIYGLMVESANKYKWSCTFTADKDVTKDIMEDLRLYFEIKGFMAALSYSGDHLTVYWGELDN